MKGSAALPVRPADKFDVFISYAGIDRQIPMITLELPRDLSSEAAWQQNREALLEAIHAAR